MLQQITTILGFVNGMIIHPINSLNAVNSVIDSRPVKRGTVLGVPSVWINTFLFDKLGNARKKACGEDEESMKYH